MAFEHHQTIVLFIGQACVNRMAANTSRNVLQPVNPARLPRSSPPIAVRSARHDGTIQSSPAIFFQSEPSKDVVGHRSLKYYRSMS